MQSEAAFPVVKIHALYWDIRARLEERRGNHMEALDIYSEAIEKQAEVTKMLSLLWLELAHWQELLILAANRYDEANVW